MVSALIGKLWAFSLALLALPGADQGVGKVLPGESFPWYDARNNRVVPLLPWPDLTFQWLTDFGNWLSRNLSGIGRWFRWMNSVRVPLIGGMGDVVAIGLAMLFLTIVLVALLELLRRYRPLDSEKASRAILSRTGAASRVEGLPAGVSLDVSDPLAEARRRRAAGDLSGAVVYLFAHQIVTLDRLKTLRLVPGKTGRQLVRSVADRELKRCVDPTLRLFEAVYYGHHAPAPAAFESAWGLAEEFERLALARAVP